MFELEKLREKINQIDMEIINLIEQRAEIVKDIGVLKEGTKYPIYVPEREDEIFKRVSSVSKNISTKAVRTIFTEIISACRSLEKEIKILNLGKNAEKISFKIFGSSVKSENRYRELKKLDRTYFEKFDFIIIDGKKIENKEIDTLIKNRRVIKVEYKNNLKKTDEFFVVFVNEFVQKDFTINIEE